jgi:hypothetical protein
MSDDVDRPISPAGSCTSEGDSVRREFFSSARVQASPTPTPLSETPKDFQLVSSGLPTAKLTNRSESDAIKTINLPSIYTTNGCSSCGPECRQPCCVNGLREQGTASSRPKIRGSGVVDPRSIEKSVDKELDFAVADDGKGTTTTSAAAVVHIHSLPGGTASSYPDEHDRVSVGSNDSGGSDHLPGEGRGETPLLPPDEQCTSVTTTVS